MGWTELPYNQKEIVADIQATAKEIRRKFHDIFKDGEFCEIKADGGLIFYRRTKNFNDLYIYANNSSKSFVLEIEERYTDCLLDKTYEKQIIIEPYSYGILVKSKQI